MLMWIHPVLQTLALCVSLSVLYLGFMRFRSAHLGRKGLVFPWKRHVELGTLVMSTWVLAFVLGLGAAWWSWKAVFLTGLHYQLGLAMLPLILFGLGSGWLMDKVKARRTLLPLAHGVANAILVGLALTQLCTGLVILRDMVMG